jgi:hypothetical protein
MATATAAADLADDADDSGWLRQGLACFTLPEKLNRKSMKKRRI